MQFSVVSQQSSKASETAGDSDTMAFRDFQRTSTWLFILLVALTGVALRLYTYSYNRSFWSDEANFALNFVDRSIGSLLTSPMNRNQSAPPGFIALASTSASVFGVRDWALRLPAILSGILMVIAGCALVDKAGRAGPAKLGGIVLLALSPELIYYSTEFKPYATDALFTVVLLLAFMYRRTRHGTGLLAATVVLAPLLSTPSIFVIAPIGLWLAAEAVQSRSPKQTIIVGSAFVAGLLVSAGYQLLAQADRQYLTARWTQHGGFAPFLPKSIEEWKWYWMAIRELPDLAFLRVGPARPGYVTPTELLPISIALGLAFCASIAAAASSRRPLALISIAAILATMAASALKIYPFSSRLILFLVPAFAVILMTAIDVAGEKLGRLAASLLTFLLALSIYAPLHDLLTRDEPIFADVKGAIGILNAQAQPGDALAVTLRSQRTFEFYERVTKHPDLPVYLVTKPTADQKMFADVTGAKRIWLLSSNTKGKESKAVDAAIAIHKPIFQWRHYSTRLALFEVDPN